MSAVTAAWFLGVAIGLRHALEPDHLAAVSTLVAGEKRLSRAALLGASWGLGHAAAILAAGGALVVLQTAMPGRLGMALELLVAALLLALGVRALVQSVRLGRGGEPGEHRHGPLRHSHAGPEAHLHLGGATLARRPFLIGVVHGLAGSGAVAALALASLPGVGARLVYVGLFGIGSIGGMAVLTGVAGVGLSRLLGGVRARAATLVASGALSLVVGVVHGWGPLAGLLGP